MSILYFDDDRDDVEIFCEAINEIDPSINCRTSLSTNDIVNLINSECPDYLFLDFRMSVTDGKQLLNQIRALECFKRTKVILYSTYMRPNDIEEFKDMGVYDFIEKSGDFVEVCDGLRKVLKLI